MQCKLSNPLQDDMHFLRPSALKVKSASLATYSWAFTRSQQITDVALQQLALATVALAQRHEAYVNLDVFFRSYSPAHPVTMASIEMVQLGSC